VDFCLQVLWINTKQSLLRNPGLKPTFDVITICALKSIVSGIVFPRVIKILAF